MIHSIGNIFVIRSISLFWTENLSLSSIGSLMFDSECSLARHHHMKKVTKFWNMHFHVYLEGRSRVTKDPTKDRKIGSNERKVLFFF